MASEILGILFAEPAVWSILAAFALCSPPAPRLHLADCWLRGTKVVLSSFITVPTALHQTLNQWCWGSRLEETLPINKEQCQHPTLSSHTSKVFPTHLEDLGHGTICHKGQGALWRAKPHRYTENIDDNYATSSITAFGFCYPSYPINFQISSINRWSIIETSLYECKVLIYRYKIKHKF